MTATKKLHKYTLGKCDYNDSGRKNHLAEVEWSWDGKRFSMSAHVWNTRKTNYVCCGQMVDELLQYFPHDQKLRRMIDVWKRWHLNDMKAGTPKQTAEIKRREALAEEYARKEEKAGRYFYDAALTKPNWHALCHLFGCDSYYGWCCAILREAGLLEDSGYSYGTAWLLEELPPDVVAEIESW